MGLLYFDDNFKFAKNAEQITANVKNISEEDNSKKTVAVIYSVDKEPYTKTIELISSEADRYKPGDKIEVFYDKNAPSKCRYSKKSVLSQYVTLFMIMIIDIAVIAQLVLYILKTKMNKKLIQDDNFILASFDKIKEVTSITLNNLNGEKNYIIFAKYNKDGVEYSFKSYKLKVYPENLIDIKVYVDNNNYKKYLVDVEDFLQE